MSKKNAEAVIETAPVLNTEVLKKKTSDLNASIRAALNSDEGKDIVKAAKLGAAAGTGAAIGIAVVNKITSWF